MLSAEMYKVINEMHLQYNMYCTLHQGLMPVSPCPLQVELMSEFKGKDRGGQVVPSPTTA